MQQKKESFVANRMTNIQMSGTGQLEEQSSPVTLFDEEKSNEISLLLEKQNDASTLYEDGHNVTKKRKLLPIGVQFLISILFLAAGAFLVMYVLWEHNYYASGNDIWGHLFKSNLLYQNMMKGNYYPLFTEFWYNGIQPYRYWAPLPYYILAGLQYLANGDAINSYFLFAGLSFFVGGAGWLLWGVSTRRMTLCTFIAFLWFFMPENFRVYFCEGNIPRMVTAFLIPYLVYFLWLFVQKEKKWAAGFISVLTALIALSHLMISAMMGIAAFVFLVFFAFENKKYLRALEAIVSMILGYVLIGIWLVPALVGGLVGMDPEASTSVMKSLTYSLWSSLNPMNRINGVTDTFYYGISIILISLLGILFAERKGKAGYYTNIIILLCTTPALVPVLSKLPLSQLLWMMRFATIAYAFFLWSFIEWKNARRYFILALSVLILIDCLPSLLFSRYYTQTRGNFVSELNTAKEITKQRVNLLDFSYLGSYPSWELCNGDHAAAYTFGWAWQGAATASNIVKLNTAMENGNYEYLFDRCVSLGDDTVLILKQHVTNKKETKTHLVEAAEASGYYLYSETNEAYIFHFDVVKNFAVQTKYEGIAIGKYAGDIVFPYPAFVGGSDNIEDYTVKELSGYKIIYLSGFEYNDRKTAEKMVTELADKGVRIVIDMNHIPVVKENKRMYFLGVVAQDIQFNTSYPTLTYRGKNYDTATFPKGFTSWNTKYLDGITNKLGTADYYGQKLTFAGTNENKNIMFLGFNLLFYGMQTQDPSIYQILNNCLQMELNELPKRTIVPITVKYKSNQILIDTVVTGVNTTIAYQDNYRSKDHIVNQDNLLFVTKKHTKITLVYPFLKKGEAVSVAGIVGILMWRLIIAFIDRLRKKNVEQGDV